MSGGYRTGQPPTELAPLLAELETIKRRLDTLERPSGEQLARVVEELQAWVADIQAQLDDYLANDAYTKAQVDARITNPGLVGNVSSAGSARFDGGLLSNDVYNHLVTGGGAYRATWTHESGFLGYAPSSRRFKTEPRNADFTLDDVLKLRGFFWEYLATAPYSQEGQATQFGLLAEDTHAAGFTWAVDYDEDGKPFGIRDNVIAVIVLEGLRLLATEVAELKRGSRGVEEEG